MKKLKTWNGNTFYTGNQAPAFICARTKKRAIELFKKLGPSCTAYYFNGAWSQGGCDLIKSIATEEGVWVAKSRMPRAKEDYERIA